MPFVSEKKPLEKPVKEVNPPVQVKKMPEAVKDHKEKEHRKKNWRGK